MSGDAVWVAVDGYTGATALSSAAANGLEAIAASGISWWDSFIGFVPGSIGETSTLAILIGGGFLMFTKIASWRIVAGYLPGYVGYVLTVQYYRYVWRCEPHV